MNKHTSDKLLLLFPLATPSLFLNTDRMRLFEVVCFVETDDLEKAARNAG